MTPSGAVVAVVAAFDRDDTVGPTVAALRSTGRLDRVVVVDDGSRDATSAAAREAGADVVRLPRNRGKGGALSVGIAAAPEAATYLLVDADLGASAAAAIMLLGPVREGEADMAVAVLPAAGGSGGFGVVRRLAAWGVARATGWRPRAPLSGQRAVDGPTLRSLLPLAQGFALETALGIDAVRAGARVIELDLPVEHRATGRGPAGFMHRGRQGADIALALSGRLGGRWLRPAAALAAAALGVAAVAGLAVRRTAAVAPLGRHPGPVLVFGVPGLTWDDVTGGGMPALRALVAQGAAGSVLAGADAGAGGPADGYATLGAGAPAEHGPAQALPAEEGGAALARQSGRREVADIAVVGAPGAQRATRTAAHRRWVVTTAVPGSLGAALHRAGLRTGAVGAPAAALAVMDESGWVDAGSLLREAPAFAGGPVVTAPADGAAFAAAAGAALQRGHVVVADPGEVERARLLAPLAFPSAAGALRARAVGRTDGVLSQVLRLVPAGTVVVVVAPTPGPYPVPLVIAGPGVGHGRIELSGHGPGRQLTLADVTTTVMRLAGARVPSGATGRPLGVARDEPGSGGAAMLAGLGRSAHLVGGGAGVDAAAAPVTAALLGLLGLAGAVWLVRERGWPEDPAPGGGRASPAAASRWLAACAVVAASLPALALAQAAIAQAASGTRVGPLGGLAGAAAFVGVVLLGSVAVLARRAAAAEPRRAVRAAAWALLAGGSLTLALAPQAGRWAMVAPPSSLLGGWAGAGPAAAAAVLGGALLACATAEGALGRAVPVAVGAGVLAVPALGDDPVAAGIAVLAGGVALAWHLAPGPRRLGALVAALAAAVLAAAPALARTGMAATLARGLGADVFGWRSPWLPTALLALGAAAAIATVVVPGAPGADPDGGESGGGPSSVDSTSIRPETETAPTTPRPEGAEAAGRRGDRAAGWGLLVAGLLAAGLHPDGMPTAALLFSQLAGLAVMVAVRAGEPEPLLSMADPSQFPPRRTPVSA